MNLQSGANQIASVDPSDFFNKGTKVSIDLIFNDISIKALFYAKDGFVFVKGDFERASSISVNLNECLTMMGEQLTYNIAAEKILPNGLQMVMKDYSDAKKKLESDLKYLNNKISKILDDISSEDLKENIMHKIHSVVQEKEKLSYSLRQKIYRDAVNKIDNKIHENEVEKVLTQSIKSTKIDNECDNTNDADAEDEDEDEDEDKDED